MSAFAAVPGCPEVSHGDPLGGEKAQAKRGTDKTSSATTQTYRNTCTALQHTNTMRYNQERLLRKGTRRLAKQTAMERMRCKPKNTSTHEDQSPIESVSAPQIGPRASVATILNPSTLHGFERAHQTPSLHCRQLAKPSVQLWGRCELDIPKKLSPTTACQLAACKARSHTTHRATVQR